jgi:hypothetical protein
VLDKLPEAVTSPNFLHRLDLLTKPSALKQ